MNIYKIEWLQAGAYNLNAVVISDTEENALKLTDFFPTMRK